MITYPNCKYCKHCSDCKVKGIFNKWIRKSNIKEVAFSALQKSFLDFSEKHKYKFKENQKFSVEINIGIECCNFEGKEV